MFNSFCLPKAQLTIPATQTTPGLFWNIQWRRCCCLLIQEEQDNKRNSRIPGPCQTLNENWWQTIFSVRLRRRAHPAVRRGSGIGFNLSNHGWRNCVRENTNAHLPARGLRLVLGGMLGSIGVTLTEACTTGNETANNGAKAGRWWWQFFLLRFLG